MYIYICIYIFIGEHRFKTRTEGVEEEEGAKGKKFWNVCFFEVSKTGQVTVKEEFNSYVEEEPGSREIIIRKVAWIRAMLLRLTHHHQYVSFVSCYRAILHRALFLIHKRAARQMQKIMRRAHAHFSHSEVLVAAFGVRAYLRRIYVLQRQQAATTIQRVNRQTLTHSLFLIHKRAALQIQAVMCRACAQFSHVQMLVAALRVRAYLQRKYVQLQRQQAATTIQRVNRQRLRRIIFMGMVWEVVVLQCGVHRLSARIRVMRMKKEYKMQDSALVVQCWWRGLVACKCAVMMAKKCSIEVLSGFIHCHLRQGDYLNRLRAVSHVQKYVKMKMLHCLYAARKEGAVELMRWMNKYLIRLRYDAMYAEFEREKEREREREEREERDRIRESERKRARAKEKETEMEKAAAAEAKRKEEEETAAVAAAEAKKTEEMTTAAEAKRKEEQAATAAAAAAAETKRKEGERAAAAVSSFVFSFLTQRKHVVKTYHHSARR